MRLELTLEELGNCIAELLDWDAFELQIKENEVLLPYLMNDATEYFIRLEDCRIQGEWCGEKNGVVELAFEEEGDLNGLVIRQADASTLSIRFGRAWKEEHCYQYHRIGHQWRKEKGEERLRRLVNLLCVLHDKCSYLGRDAYTEEEAFLAKLIEFQPLCYWTPINDSIEDWYPETMDGILAMEELVERAGDSVYLNLLKQYLLFWENFDEGQSGRRMQKKLFKLRELQNNLSRALTLPEHEGILCLLEAMIEEASLNWKPRTYSKEHTESMEALRESKEEEFKKQGFTGSYPKFEKVNLDTGERENVFLVEEHPFMELEWKDYQFRIHEIWEVKLLQEKDTSEQ